MSHPQTSQPIPLQIPIKGLNKRDALAKMGPEYSPWCLNWEPEAQFLRIRNGWSIHANLKDVTQIRALNTYGDSTLFAYCTTTGSNNSIYDATTAGSYEAGDPEEVETTTEGARPFSRSSYASRCAFVSSASWNVADRVWNGSAWAAPGFTYDDGGGADPIGGRTTIGYKGRVFIGDTGYEYLYYTTSVGSITGATSRLDLTSLFEDGPNVSWAARLTSPGMRADETFFAFGNRAGEILVYAGDYPDASNWELVGQFKTPTKPTPNAVLEYRNDIWICTEAGIVSLRKLFQNGSEKPEDLTVSSQIDGHWTALMSAIRENGEGPGAAVRIAYWPQANKIYVTLRGQLDRDGTYTNVSSGSTMFTYNTISEGWTVSHVISNGDADTVYMANAIYRAVGRLVLKYDLTIWKDQTDTSTYAGIDYELESAYMSLGSANKNKQVTGFEPIIKTDFAKANVTMKAAADFGRKVSGATTSNLSSGYQIPDYSVGVDGTFIQYRIEGTTDQTSTTGLELYSVGAKVS